MVVLLIQQIQNSLENKMVERSQVVEKDVQQEEDKIKDLVVVAEEEVEVEVILEVDLVEEVVGEEVEEVVEEEEQVQVEDLVQVEELQLNHPQLKKSLQRVHLQQKVLVMNIQMDKDSINMRIKQTQKHSLVKEDLVIEVIKMYQRQVKNAQLGLTVLLILHQSILIMVLRVTFVEIQFHRKEPKPFGALLREELPVISGNIVHQ
jgi:hypothetical protein